MRQPRYVAFARIVGAYHRCVKDHNAEGERKHQVWLDSEANNGPSGSGWDSGTTCELSESTSEKLVFYGTYHHMNAAGMYNGWSEHTITVTPSLQFGFSIRISGPNRCDIKEYLRELFEQWLGEEIE